MKKLLFLFCILILIGSASAQYPFFNKLLYGGYFAAGGVVEVNNGYIVVNESLDSLFNKTILLKLNYNGDTVWKKTFGKAPASITPGYGAVRTVDGNVVFTTFIRDTVTTNSQTPADIIFFKMNSITGDTIWTRRYRAPKDDNINSIIQTKDGGYALIGATDSYGQRPGWADYYLIKTDSMGYMQWHKTFGGNGNDQAFAITKTLDNGYIVGGYSSSFDTTSYDYYAIKLDSLGNKEWDKPYSVNNAYCGAGPITILSNGDYLITHLYNTNNFNYLRTTILRVSSLGNVIWQKYLSYSNLIGLSLSSGLNNDGTITIAGVTQRPGTAQVGHIMKIDASQGDTIWSKVYSLNPTYSTTIYDIKKTSDNGYIFCGSSVDSTVVERSWVVKTDCMGNDSIHYPPQAGCCGMYSAQVLSNKANYSFCKGDSITLTVSPSYASYTWSNSATTQSITVKQGGNYTVTIASGGGCTLTLPFLVQMDTLPKPVITKNDSVLTSNYSNGNRWYLNGHYIPAATGQIYIAHTTGTYTLVVTNSCGSGTSQPITTLGVSSPPSAKNNAELFVWPNPVTDGIIHIVGAKNTNTIEFYNLLGEKVLQTKATTTIDVSSLPKGMYLMKLQNAGGEKVYKAIVQ